MSTPLRRSLAPATSRLLVAASGVLIGCALGARAITQERDGLGDIARLQAESAMARVDASVEATLAYLSASVAYIEGSAAVGPAEFSAFMEDVAPGGTLPWHALGVAVGSWGSQRSPWVDYVMEYETEFEGQGYPEFDLQRFPAERDADLRTAAVLLMPGSVRGALFGFDMSSEPVRQRTILHALQTGEIQVTDPISLAPDVAGRPQSLLAVASLAPDALAPSADFALAAVSLTPSRLLENALSDLGVGDVRYSASVVTPYGDTTTSFESEALRARGFDEGSIRTAGPVDLEIPLGPNALTVRWQASRVGATAPLSTALPPLAAVLTVTLLTLAFIRRVEGEQARLEETLTVRERELRQSEVVVARSQRREALGRLTGGVAHDFNNLLSVVIGSLDLMAGRLGEDPEAERLRQNALTASEQGARLTRRLLALGRQAPLRPTAFDVGDALQAARTILRASVPENIELVIQDGGEPCWVLADPTQFEAAVLNLVINARDAMPSGGVLTISRHPTSVPLEDANEMDVPEGDYIVLSVRDTGVGMSSEVLAFATDPFFTTKGPGAGTGLGLSTVLGFARQSGGDVVIDSTEGEGTVVRLLLPEVAQPVRIHDTREAIPSDTARGLRVLLVEDEEGVRKVIRRQLEQLDCEVETVTNGDLALEALEGDGVPDLVLSDVVMPGSADGWSVAREARRQEIPVILMSGYPRGLSDSEEAPDVQLLAKPFRSGELARAIREELAAELAPTVDA